MPSARTAPTMGSLSRVPHPARLSACDAALTRRASVALRCAAAGASAARARTDPRQARPRRHPLFLALEVVVEVVHLPLDAVRILHPELVLVGVAAVDAHLLLHGKAGRLDAGQLRDHGLHGIDLDADVVDGPRADRAAGGEREVDGRPLWQEFDVALLDLHRVPAEELLVEVAAPGEIRHVHV